MLTQKDINRLKTGQIPNVIAGQPFIVIRERVSLRGSDNGGWQWSVNTSPEKEDMTIVTRDEALEIIRENQMSPALTLPEGQIYEQEGRPFEKIYARNKKKAS